ncbi:MAG: hypothetical protein IPI07_16245, partial [Flavobacteriales bacterium]|nr:hypothetical protein [Flavobacteriales bacterium]
LTDVQIGALFDHIRRNGKLLSVYEVQTIDAWDARTLALVRPFVNVRENAQGTNASLKEIPAQWRSRDHRSEHHRCGASPWFHGPARAARRSLHRSGW